MAKIYLIASGKGGVGKTTICANLGIIYAQQGYKVVLIDADMGLNNLDVTLGIEDKIKFDLIDVLDSRVKLSQALVDIEGVPNLKLLASTKVNVSERVNTQMFINLVNEISLQSDFIFIDAPAGIENGFHRAASAANEAIIVTTSHISAIKDADRAIGVLSTYGLKGIGLIVNRFRKDLFNKGEILDAESISELLRIPLYGVVPESDKLGIYSNIISYNNDKAKQSYYEISKNLCIDQQSGIQSRKQSFFRRLFG